MSERPGIYLNALGLINALGQGAAPVCAGMLAGDTAGIVVEDGWLPGGAVRVGRVSGALPALAGTDRRLRSRTNALVLAALEQIEEPVAKAIERHGASRVGVVLGTSTAGIAEGEAAIGCLRRAGALPVDFHYRQQEIGSPARFLAARLGVNGPAYVVSTACTSSAKALASARNLLRTGLCDAVIAGGADSLCRLTLNGFAALESLTPDLCNPMSVNRRGINIGEAAALFLVSREAAGVELLGAGESSDAYHISAPDPEGRGAELAVRAALADAGVDAGEIDYINLHGTATPKNDEMEAGVISRVFGSDVPCSSTKPLIGHALGAAGATEAAFCWLLLSHYNTAGTLPPHVWDGARDPALPAIQLTDTATRLAKRAGRILMSNSFAFGGNNISLVIGDAR